MNNVNLRPWKPGQSGNPAGRPKRKQRRLEEQTERLKPFRWNKGVSGNPSGRPKGSKGSVHPNSLKNLKKFKSGQSGNPVGRPVGIEETSHRIKLDVDFSKLFEKYVLDFKYDIRMEELLSKRMK